ncbi:MAG: bifunctional adenosylcobinamide kinase/adenosylcobinamide-phosphate guanylyltransferase [Chloroflexota bacterium]
MGQLTFILGGARSGKSAFGARLADDGGSVLFVATAEAHDEGMRQRIEAHKRERPPNWDTLEEPTRLLATLDSAPRGHDVILLDCLTLWVSNLLIRHEEDPAAALDMIDGEAERLLERIQDSDSDWIVISNEVGLGVVPPTAIGGVYRDALGRVNQAFARQADTVYLMAAGLALDLKSLGARPWGDYGAP